MARNVVLFCFGIRIRNSEANRMMPAIVIVIDAIGEYSIANLPAATSVQLKTVRRTDELAIVDWSNCDINIEAPLWVA